jgi:hypothetical protein
LHQLDKERVICEAVQDDRQTQREFDTIAWYDSRVSKIDLPVAVESLRGQSTTLKRHTSQLTVSQPLYLQQYLCCTMLNDQVRRCVAMSPVAPTTKPSNEAANNYFHCAFNSVLLFSLGVFLALFGAI